MGTSPPGGQIPWAVNGISFAGDYLSAASFLGICGLIATRGYDGFLYSIGYLAGWIVALFVVAEPMKRLGKYTFTDALDSQFNSRGIQLAAALSTLIVSIFYLIPQMVGAGTLVTPLLGLPHAVGVIMVGTIVILIVATAGMASTTWVQFLKGGLLIVFSTILVIAVCHKGLTTKPDQSGSVAHYDYRTLEASQQDEEIVLSGQGNMEVLFVQEPEDSTTLHRFVKIAERIPLEKTSESWRLKLKGTDLDFPDSGTIAKRLSGLMEKADGTAEVVEDLSFLKNTQQVFVVLNTWWKVQETDDGIELLETQSLVEKPDGAKWINGLPMSELNTLRQVGGLKQIAGQSQDTGPLGPFEYLSLLSRQDTVFNLPAESEFSHEQAKVTLYYDNPTPGTKVMRPGMKFKVEGTFLERLDFASLMLALFFGTAALPHILIRYYTVPSPAAARKSTIVAIAAIGFFYVLTMYMGLGAAVNEVINPTDNNMSAPLLARSFNTFLFAVISAIAFATVLGTVSGLIVASSGAVAHDLLDRFFSLKMTDKQKVYAGKLAALMVGLVAIILGIIFEGMNVAFLVGWAFAVAASANLPAIIMLLFWKKTTAKGIMASILVGMVSAVGLILISPSMYAKYYGVTRDQVLEQGLSPLPLDNPGIIAIPLSFITLVIVSLLTQKKGQTPRDTPGLDEGQLEQKL